MKWINLKAIMLLAIGIFACPSRVFGVSDDLYTFRSGIHIGSESSRTDKQLEQVLTSLRLVTGLTEINVANNEMTLGNRLHINGGSKTARELIIATLDSGDSFMLERRDNSSTISFAQIESTARYVDASGKRHSEWQLRIDFSDFEELVGDTKARAAFNPAINILHELAHAVFGYLDPYDGNDTLGECERYINQIRFELGLPQRVYYYPHYSLATGQVDLTFVKAELMFVEARAEGRKPRELFVHFNVEKVFDFSKARSRTTIQASLLAQRRAQGR